MTLFEQLSLGGGGVGGAVVPTAEDEAELPPCCVREKVENTVRARTVAVLRRHDPVARAERARFARRAPTRRRCACPVDHHDDDEDASYPALAAERAREDRRRAEGEAARDVDRDDDDDSSDSDSSDSEFDHLLDEEEVDERERALLEERRAELEWRALHADAARRHGHGVHRRVAPERAARAAGLTGRGNVPARVVLHLYDPDAVASARTDLILERLAPTYLGTVFLRTEGRRAASSIHLEEHRRRPLRVDVDLPCLLVARDGRPVHAAARYAGIADGDGRVDPDALEDWLDRSDALLRDLPPYETLCAVPADDDDDEEKEEEHEEEDYYACGVDGCRKSFAHTHVGTETTEQRGLVVSEEDVL